MSDEDDMELGDPRMEDPAALEEENSCPHPANRQRSISHYEVHRDTVDGPETSIQEEVVCDVCGQNRRIRTPLTGIYRKCSDCGDRVFTTQQSWPLAPHKCRRT